MATTPSFVDTKLFAWMLENGSVWANVYFRTLLPEPEVVCDTDEKGNKVLLTEKIKRIIKNIFLSYISSVMAEVGAIYTIKLLDRTFFAHVPHFTSQRRSDSPFTWNAFYDWFRGNWWLQYLGGGIALGLIESFWPEWIQKELKETKFDFLRFIRNYSLFRVIVDITFYLGHRALHVNEKLYTHIHKRHHEHYTTNLRTNWHFTSPDLFIESALPIGVGFFVLRLLGIKMGRFEMHVMQSYVAFHEIGTHLGKPVKLISSHPILSIFYDTLFPWIDARAIEFHETHHNRRDTNYGITPWLENLVLKNATFQKDILKNGGF